tara:strand:+ start:792 stop:1691 length:900 start_codon:yes stop_codon:yes gene_type:complete
MTALLLYENTELNDIVTISYPDNYDFEGKVAYLEEGTQVSVEQLLEFLLVYSANDSAYATAMYISNSVVDFVELMNTTASKLNMTKTNFKNPDGLDESNHYTTLNDLLILSKYILKNTKLIDITNKSKFYFDQNGTVKKFINTNNIIDEGFKGLKTGWTTDAGLTFIGYNQDYNRNIITIVNKSYVDEDKESHFFDTLKLYQESLSNFDDNTLLKSSDDVYIINNSFESSPYTMQYDISKFGNINISTTMYLRDINISSIILSNNFDDEIFKIPFITSEKAVNYNFLLSNVISKLVLSD